MERDRQIFKAKEVLRKLMRRYTKPNHRIHKQAAEDNAQRLRALEGICGKCVSIDPIFAHIDGKDTVVLGCKKEHNPTLLYGNTVMGEKVFCEDYRRAR